MSLTNTDEVLVPPEALEYIEKAANGETLFNFEVVEHFFEWLRRQDKQYIVDFLRKALEK